jgi:tetratricopeptide (TPR) repeat protein
MQRKIFFPIFLFVFPFVLTAQSTAKEWYTKGVELKNKQDHSGALTAFKNAISKKAGYNNAYYEAGLCCNELENFEEAVDFFMKYNAVSNTDTKNKCNELGYSYYRLRKSKNAIEEFEKTLALFANNGTALRGIGNVYYEIEENYDRAILYFEKALAVDEEESKPIYYKLGWLYNDKERYDDAIKVLLKAVAYDSEDSGYREELGYAYYMKEEYEFAITQLNKAISLDENSKLGYYYKGLCFIATNKKGDAMSMYYKLKELSSDEAGELLEKINGMK